MSRLKALSISCLFVIATFVHVIIVYYNYHVLHKHMDMHTLTQMHACV